MFHWIVDVRPTLRLASPIVIAQLAMIGSRTADTIMAGRLSSADLAAVATGMSYWMILGLLLIGLGQGVSAIVSQRDGAEQPPTSIGRFLQQCLWVGLALGLVVAVLIWLTGRPVVTALGLSAQATHIAAGYLNMVAFGAPAMAGLLVLRFGAEGMGDTRAYMLVGLLALVANVGLNYVFMYGALGAPALGGIGCGLATAIVDWLSLVAMQGLMLYRRRLRPLALFAGLQRPTREATAEFFAVGVPIGGMLTFEAGFFGVTGLLMARFGDDAAAAHQVAINFSAVCFMVPLSLAFASTVRVGNALGRGQREAARIAAHAGVGMALMFSLLSASLMLAFPRQIVAIYTDAPGVTTTAVGFLLWAALFQVFDCLQAAAAGGLRGYKDVRIPLLLTLIAYWVVGFPLGAGLAFAAGMGPAALWWGIIAGLGAAAVMLLWRLLRVSSATLAGPEALESLLESPNV